MDISVSEQDGTSVVSVAGRIDSSNAGEFESPLQELVANGAANIVLEMSGVDYMSSVGLRVIVSAMKTLNEKGGHLHLAAITTPVRGVLLLMGTDLFAIYDTVDEAIAAF